ncbi:hypothetical protein scyTo_0023969, partial [Scyliorhinus torazame]|nr:hypothetical protein [Scyliorhinus torazame]
KNVKNYKIESYSLTAPQTQRNNAEGLGFDEFKIFWNRMKQWKSAFLYCDHDRSGTMSAHELRTAIKNSGKELGQT